MRTGSFSILGDSIKFLVSMMAPCSLAFWMAASMSGIVNAQTRIQADPVFENPVEPSPLSQYSVDGGFFGQASNIAKPDFQAIQSAEVLISKRVDLAPTLQRYAALKNCSLNEAFLKTASFLRMFPHDQLDTRTYGASAYYRIVAKDVYQITAPKKFFARLPAQLSCVENGIRHVELKIHFVSIPVDDKIDIQDYVLPGSHLAFNNKLPQAKPVATQATYRNEGQAKTLSPLDSGTMVSASETVTKAYPTFMARMDKTGVAAFLKEVRSDSSRTLTQSPTVRAIPGDPLSISDGSTRPFVVGVNRIDGNFAMAHRPIVQSIEEGAMLKIRAKGQNGKIRIDSDLALSQIESVSNFAYKDIKNELAETVTVQVPEHRLKQVHLSTLVDEGKTIFIEAFGPSKVQYLLPKKPLEPEVKLGEREMRTIIMVTPKWVNVDDPNMGRRQ
ncbi:MAG: hypothetical protein P8J27_11465 [Mariniblastus sp.]|nr:hypothetical protein [Mariniblastus sp.]